VRYPPQSLDSVKVIQPLQVRCEEARIAFLEAATEFLRALKRAVDYYVETKTHSSGERGSGSDWRPRSEAS
jgi:hypothetical protein